MKNECKKWIHGRPAFFWREMEEERIVGEGGTKRGGRREIAPKCKIYSKRKFKKTKQERWRKMPSVCLFLLHPLSSLQAVRANHLHSSLPALWHSSLNTGIFSIFPSKCLGAKLVVFLSMFCSLARAVSAQVCPDELLFTLYSSVKLPHAQPPLFSHQLLHMLPVFIIRKYFFIKKKETGLVRNKAATQKSYQFSWLMWFLCKDFTVNTVHQETEIIF